jgi:hypothetical protein
MASRGRSRLLLRPSSDEVEFCRRSANRRPPSVDSSKREEEVPRRSVRGLVLLRRGEDSRSRRLEMRSSRGPGERCLRLVEMRPSKEAERRERRRSLVRSTSRSRSRSPSRSECLEVEMGGGGDRRREALLSDRLRFDVLSLDGRRSMDVPRRLRSLWPLVDPFKRSRKGDLEREWRRREADGEDRCSRLEAVGGDEGFSGSAEEGNGKGRGMGEPSTGVPSSPSSVSMSMGAVPGVARAAAAAWTTARSTALSWMVGGTLKRACWPVRMSCLSCFSLARSLSGAGGDAAAVMLLSALFPALLGLAQRLGLLRRLTAAVSEGWADCSRRRKDHEDPRF